MRVFVVQCNIKAHTSQQFTLFHKKTCFFYQKRPVFGVFIPRPCVSSDGDKIFFIKRSCCKSVAREDIFFFRCSSAAFHPSCKISRIQRIQYNEMHHAHRYVEQWQTMRSENLGLLLWGGVGTGKSFLAGCIANTILSPAHFGMEKRTHLFHTTTHLRQNKFFGAEKAVPFFYFRGCHVRVVV